MRIKNSYSSILVILFLIISASVLALSINHLKKNQSLNNTIIGQTTLKSADALSKNDKITSSKFSADVSSSYNPTNVSTTNLQANTQANQSGQSNIQNAAKVSDINFPIN